jgi:hypothetical protein
MRAVRSIFRLPSAWSTAEVPRINAQNDTPHLSDGYMVAFD